jgi:D-sedoheptulose 7-phosphate isomerase
MVDKLDQSNNCSADSLAMMVSQARSMLQDSIDVKQHVLDTQLEVIARIAETIFESLRAGGKVLLCGNGGSAADAQHLAAELLVRLRPHVNRDGIPALALALDTSSLTACGNDYDFQVFYERMTRTLGKSGDVLIGITTSGKSANVINALRAAREKGMVAIGLLGAGGGSALAECDLALVVPSTVTGRIQEVHITVGHAIMELVEDRLLESGFSSKPSPPA